MNEIETTAERRMTTTWSLVPTMRASGGALAVRTVGVTARWPAWGTEANAGGRRPVGTGAEMGGRWMPWRLQPRKDAATRRNALGRGWHPVIQRCPNGATRRP